MNTPVTKFADLDALAAGLRTKLKTRQYLLLFAYNGTGKTRLSMAFKKAGKHDGKPDTLYFNAYTEDLFSWDNDLKHDNQRKLHLNNKSKFFEGIEWDKLKTHLRRFLHHLSDFDFKINTDDWTITFSRNIQIPNDDGNVKNKVVEDIKISRGEERLFVWCFFLAIVQYVRDKREVYDSVKYIYIDDPISSLDDNNAIAIASYLAQMLKDQAKNQDKVGVVISSHHTLFFNVLCNELGKKAIKFMLHKGEASGSYDLRKMCGNTAEFYHVAMLKEIKQAADTGTLYTYHFGILRNLLEKTAYFHGFTNFGDCLTQDPNDKERVVQKRIINIMNHGNCSLFEPLEMSPEDKKHFKKILAIFMSKYYFNPKIFSESTTSVSKK